MSPKQSKAAYRRDLLPSVSKPLTTLKGDKIFRASRGFKMARVVSDFFFQLNTGVNLGWIHLQHTRRAKNATT